MAAANKGEIFTSFDVNAFEVPHGRDEIWRFTPLRRLRGLHDGSAPATGVPTIDVTELPGVTVETVRRGDERLGDGGVPADRIAAQAFSSFNHATIVTSRRAPHPSEPIEINVSGPGEGKTAYGHLQVRVGELAEAVVVIDQRGSGTYADNVEFVARRRRPAHGRLDRRLGRRRRPRHEPPRRARQGRGAEAHRGHPRR